MLLDYNWSPFRLLGASDYCCDTCFDAHLFQRLVCLYHVMLCACSNEVTAPFFDCKYHSNTLSRKTNRKPETPR